MNYERKTDIPNMGRPHQVDKLLPYSVRLPDRARDVLRAEIRDPNKFCRDAIIAEMKRKGLSV
jgi:hypothetical protein